MERHVQKSQVPTARTRKVRAIWIDRSLSSRSNMSAVSSSKQTRNKAKKAFPSPNVYQKKRVEAPANFVCEQKSYFEQVDAFELEEESPPAKDRWMPELKHMDAIATSMHMNYRRLLQAVQEDSPEELPNNNSMCALSMHEDPLSHILQTPQSIQQFHKSNSRGSLQSSKQGLLNVSMATRMCYDAQLKHTTEDTASEVRCKSQSLSDKPELIFSYGKVQEAGHSRLRPLRVDQRVQCKSIYRAKDLNPIIILSDDEKENLGAAPQTFQQSKHPSRQSQNLGPAGTRSNVPQIIILDDSPVSLNKVCNVHSNVAPVKCEYSESSSSGNIVPVSSCQTEKMLQRVATELLGELNTSGQNIHSHHHTDQSLVDRIKSLDFQGSKDENCLEFPKANKNCASKERSPVPKFHSLRRTEQLSTYKALLEKCGQTAALPLEETIMQFSELRDVVKLGEGTYGEAFKTCNLVLKIVPMDGSFTVNGEAQKTLAEMHTEMLLTLTLNRFRKKNSTDLALRQNVCNSFIETKMVKVCQGFYGQALIKAWEEWGAKHESENDHPGIFPETQLYMLFVLADGGKDLESFSVASFDVARSILTQVTAALAIAEEDCEFEHRDLHWGNILVASTKSNELCCKLDGTDIQIRTYGVLVHIIDFTLSRLFTGKEVLFSNLSDDPLLFEGPKGDIQAEVYRKMLNLTEGQWEKRFSKTNCYWIHYLVDILLTKKTITCPRHQRRALRAFKNRISSYESARACFKDQFFEEVQ